MPHSNNHESVADFVRWALAQLDLEVAYHNGVGQLALPEEDQSQFAGRAQLSLAMTAGGDSAESIAVGSRFWEWLLKRLQAAGEAVSVRPSTQPTAVTHITASLFAAYQVDGGRVHLGGCQLTDYPFLRLSFAAKPKDSAEGAAQEIRHLFVAHDGSSVSDELARELGLLELEPILQRPPRIDETALQSLITAGRRVAAQSTTSRDPHAKAVEPVLLALVWVKHADGALHFTVGDTTVSQSFSGWAKLLQAKPYTSPQSGASSFHLAATDDGRIDTFDQITTCQQSGRRVLKQDLVTCSVTGKQVLEEFTEACPVSGMPCLVDEFVTCAVCGQHVSKTVMQTDSCRACRQLSKVGKDDPRIVWILGEHPGLDRWNRWQLSETKSVYIAQASSWTKRLLVVVDKETLAVQHLATAGRIGSTWVPVEGSARDELLR